VYGFKLLPIGIGEFDEEGPRTSPVGVVEHIGRPQPKVAVRKLRGAVERIVQQVIYDKALTSDGVLVEEVIAAAKEQTDRASERRPRTGGGIR